MTYTPRPTTDTEAALTDLRQPTPATTRNGIADIPVLLAELDRLTDLLSQTRRDFANLLAAAHATIAADHDGESDPLWYLRDAICEHDE